MADSQAGVRPSTNKNLKKLRALSMVCSLASSWQQWAADNETKQASEPSGWTPSSLGGPTEERRKQWLQKKEAPTQPHPADGSRSHRTSGDALTPVTPQQDEPSLGAAVKVENVVKKLTSGVQERSALTEKIQRDNLPSEEEIERILRKKSSPTRRRKCSNMVSSLTKSWKQVENRPGGEGGGEAGERTRSRVGQGGSLESKREEKTPEDNAESEVKIRRSTVST